MAFCLWLDQKKIKGECHVMLESSVPILNFYFAYDTDISVFIISC